MPIIEELDKILNDINIDNKIVRKIEKLINKEKNAKEEALEELNLTKNNLETATLKIDGLNKDVSNIEELKAQITSLNNSIKEQQLKHQNEMNNFKKKTFLKEKLQEQKCYDTDLVGNLLDVNKIQINSDGTIAGIDEQIAEIKATKPYLFQNDINSPSTVIQGHKPVAGSVYKSPEISSDILANFGQELAKMRNDQLEQSKKTG